MCCLFGYYNYSGNSIKNISELTNSLSEQATVRGTDAAGIAYVNKNTLTVHKEGKSANLINFKHPDNVVCVLGHTRHSTQGSHAKNFNNHPFTGRCGKVSFALAHNGVLVNDRELRRQYNLPATKIETDSYIAVQMLEREKKLDVQNIRTMSENIDGSFAFSILDSNNDLWLVRGDSPLSLIHLPKYKLYVYASTEGILFKSLVDTSLFDEIKRGNFEEINISSGDIFKISADGSTTKDTFAYTSYSRWGRYNWWTYGLDDDFDGIDGNDAYIADLKTVAACQGFEPEIIDELIEHGFTFDEIEEYIYY